ncbi:sugar porter family MFS transporter [Planctomycetota bacterium]|nr:sugar porter family MFS transporter [Planctomycetota bacterium]
MTVSNRHTSYVLWCSFVVALGGLLFGFDTAVVSGAVEDLRSVFVLNSFELGFTVAVALIGTIFGALIFGKPADWYGRRTMLFVIGLLYLISAIGSGAAWDWYSFVFFRFIGGLGVGGASVLSPMYIAEIAPAKYRGRLVALTQFNIVFGILLAFFSNYIIKVIDIGNVDWRLMFGIEALPAAAFLLLLFAVPQSPRWLISKQRVDEAKSILLKLGSDNDNLDVVVSEISSSLDIKHHSLRERFLQRKYAVPISLAVAIAMFNQLSGINAILYYAPSIFMSAGAGSNAAFLQAVAIGFVNLIFTMLALLVIDFLGRRTLMLVGSIGYIVSLATVATAFFTYSADFTPTGNMIVLISLFVFIAAHAFGQGAVIWVFISEIFPNRVRARGQSLGAFTHWIMAALISWTFPLIAEFSGGIIFAFYTVMMVLQLIWVIFIMPETKGIPLEQIQKKLGVS